MVLGRGGLIGLIGQGVGVASEYREHRKQQKLSRENSRQEDDVVAGPSTLSPPQAQGAPARSNDVPPAYGELPAEPSNRAIARGAPVSDDQNATAYRYDDNKNRDNDDDDDDDDASELESLEDDEEDWELDEALEPADGARAPPSYDESEAEYRTTDELVNDVLLTNQAAAAATSQQPGRPHEPLPCPVILPQRRPRKRSRGFVRAYAPVLAASGIDQATFLAFLKNFHKSSQASPIFTVIQVSAMIAGCAPSVIAMAVTTVAQVAARAGAEVQSRQRTNNFLAQVNEELFKPAGLYALIMKYKPADADMAGSTAGGIAARFGIKAQVVDVSTNQTIAKYYRSTSDGNATGSRNLGDRMKTIRLASGTTRGAVQLPEAAPLIFPAIDSAVARGGVDETFKDRTKDAKKFLADYLDRRSQVQYASDDPRSDLAVPEEQRAFRSKLADPNHPIYTGGLVGLVTGGAVNPRVAQRERRSEQRFQRDERRVSRYEQRMDRGQGLSRKKQSRYEAFLDEQERRGSDGGSRGIDRFSRRGRGGPVGLVGSLIGAAVSAAANRGNDAGPAGPSGGSSSREYKDADDGRAGHQSGRRDDFGRSPNPAAALYNDRRRGRDQRGGGGGGGGGAIGTVRRLMREDVLYLIIVNLPSEAELAEAREELARQNTR